MSDPRNLSASDAARLREAFVVLQQGRAQDAIALANAIVRRVPQSPDALHLVALCCKALGDLPGATSAFDAAIKLAPAHAPLLANYANFLGSLRRLPEALALYERVLAVSPDQAEYWMNFGLTLLDAGETIRAIAAFERALQIRPASSTLWQGLGAARRAAGDLSGAATASQRAVELNAANGAAWTNLGVVRRLQGDPFEALNCYAHARRAGFQGAELDDAEASAWLDCGDPTEALRIVRRLVATSPSYATGHVMLARLLWEHGATLAPGESSAQALRAAADQQPGNRRLRLELCRFLIETRTPSEAIARLRQLRSEADEPALVVLEARALEQLGDAAAARRLFDTTSARMQHDAQYANMLARHLLMTGSPDAAAGHCLAVLQREPFNQLALAQLGLAWRLSNDAREFWLCDYERFVRELPIETAAEFDDVEQFLPALQAALGRLHIAQREPVDQSLRGGTQTAGVLFGSREPAVRALRDACERAITLYLAMLPDDDRHPFLGRKRRNVRFSGSWSVRLKSQGRHANHFHQEGWISSAFYVQLPPSVRDAMSGSTAGWIQFGAPPEELQLSLPPRRLVRPQEGRLVLFPSYCWHGTLPFEDAQPRLTVAFDAVPA